MDIEDFDRVVYLFESELYRILPLHQAIMLDSFPRQHRLIVDTDGMYNELIQLDGYDFNHRDRGRPRAMDRLHGRARRPGRADAARRRRRIQGARAAVLRLRSRPRGRSGRQRPPKQCDILHVGHNWWRWREVESELLPALRAASATRSGEIGFIGLWWDAPPPEGPAAGPPKRSVSDPYALRAAADRDAARRSCTPTSSRR